MELQSSKKLQSLQVAYQKKYGICYNAFETFFANATYSIFAYYFFERNDMPNMKQCKNGHYYDEKKSRKCPYCSGAGQGAVPLGAGVANAQYSSTIPVAGDIVIPPVLDTSGAANAGYSPTLPVDPPQQPKNHYGSAAPARNGSMGVTVMVDEIVVDEKTGETIRPVCGWLVCVTGENKGRSFNIHSQYNNIGRGDNFDINLFFDDMVSSNGNAIIAYDERHNKFLISGTGNGNMIYHNDNVCMNGSEELKDYDTILIGNNTYVFRSFCNEQFVYEKE